MKASDFQSSSVPLGVRDYAPEAAAEFYALQGQLMRTFEQSKYQRVMTPAFELAQVFERGLSPLEASRLLRFTDPQTGDALVLRSDITPQIARLVCGALVDAPLPLRLCYFGRVFRLRQHTEFQRREVAQAGVELVGDPSEAADIEVIDLCNRALQAAQVPDYVLSLGHVGVLSAALENVPEAVLPKIRDLLRKKDTAGLKHSVVNLPNDTQELLLNIATWHGSAENVFRRVEPWMEYHPAIAAAVKHLATLLAGLGDAAERCLIDLGQMLGFGYYTGLVFHAWAPGAGTAIASGGRYDNLVARYGRDLPSVGFAIDEEGITAVRSRPSTRSTD
jgi:ATP phosphoribosyltransferase regulatory subunit